MNQHEQIQSVVRHACDSLMEHVDSVRIFVTYHDGSKDESAGHIQEWMVTQDQYARTKADSEQRE